MIYTPQFVSTQEAEELLSFFSTLRPIWEQRYSLHRPLSEGQTQRQLLRPVYWLGNWQFACLNYYHPPKGIEWRCVRAEPYPPVLARLVAKMEQIVRGHFLPKDVPQRWQLNTCLINFYGSQLVNGEWIDTARVGEHKDFEPGPVGSLSFGERALIQFVESRGRGTSSNVVLQQWLEDRSLQIFGGKRFKVDLFHRVQRVDTKNGTEYTKLRLSDFRTRRINLTFRYVPDEHIQPLFKFPKDLQLDVKDYVSELAKNSEYWQKQIAKI